MLKGRLCCAGGTSWEERAPLGNITGAGRCEFIHNLMYCFGGSLGAGMPTVTTLSVSAHDLSHHTPAYRRHSLAVQRYTPKPSVNVSQSSKTMKGA